MAKQLSEEEIYEEARKRVKAKRDFYQHLAVYVVVNIILVLVWRFAAGGGYPWFLWPLGGWGVGVLFNFLNVFVFPGKPEKGAIEKEAEKLRQDQN